MKAWWRGLSGRERGMIALAIGVAFAVCFVQFAIFPLHDKRQSARAAHVDALDMLAEVRAGVARASAPQAQGASGDAASVRAALMASARERGLAIARVQPLGDGGLSLRFDDADPIALYDWLAAAIDERGVGVRQANLNRDERGGGVQATIVLDGGGA